MSVAYLSTRCFVWTVSSFWMGFNKYDVSAQSFLVNVDYYLNVVNMLRLKKQINFKVQFSSDRSVPFDGRVQITKY